MKEWVVKGGPPIKGLAPAVYLNQDPDYPNEDVILVVEAGHQTTILAMQQSDCDHLAQILPQVWQKWLAMPRLELDDVQAHDYVDLANRAKPSLVPETTINEVNTLDEAVTTTVAAD